MALDLSTLTTEQQIAAIYIGYYDRAADPFGEAFWVTAFENPNISLAQNASFFATQAETLAAYPFLGDPSIEEANAFITEVYLNLFNRAPEGPDDVAEGEMDGLTFWSNALIAAINGDEGALSVGEIILSIIQGAQGDDITTVMNKINVAVAWTDAADAAGLNEETSYTDSPTAQASAKSIIEGVTSDESTVTSAKADIDAFFDSTTPVVDGETYFLTSATDVMEGTDDNDEFLGYVQQNPFAGGLSNSLSSAERLDGNGGDDRLYAEMSYEFLGVDAFGVGALDTQPRLTSIEEIDIEARDLATFGSFGFEGDSAGGGAAIIIDGKHIADHEELSSYYSDGDLVFENVTTLTEGGTARNTDAITVGMDHTDNFNSDCDASDLTVLFDNDYLLSGQDAVSEIVYFLLDEEAERLNNPDRLNNIDVDGIIFNVINADGTVTEVVIESDAANTAGTHQGFVNALQDPFQAAIDAGLVPEGSLLFLDPTQVDTTFDDDGNESDDIPGIAVVSGDGTELVATGFSRIEEQIGRYDVYGDFRSSGQEIIDEPITVNIDLHKAGRGGEGGDLIVGGKAQNTPDGIADGIEVFKINVLGAGDDDPNGGMTKPSNVGTITSTGDELREVYIATDPMYAAGDTYASLTVRNGFDQDTGCDCDEEYLLNGPSRLPLYDYYDGHGNVESGDLELINADEFLGDLTLGDIDANNNSGRITNADTITAQGGGDVTLGLYLDGTEEGQAYSVTTGSGNDIVDMKIDGDALDYAGSSLNISTNAGNDTVYVDTSYVIDYGYMYQEVSLVESSGDFNEQLNQVILDSVDISTGDGDDMIASTVGSNGNLNIDAGAGDDFINTSGGRSYYDYYDDFEVSQHSLVGEDEYCGPEMPVEQDLACWVFNFDDARGIYGGLDDVPGVPLSNAYVGGATVTVTLSGAGVYGDLNAGGGVMAQEAQNDILGLFPGAQSYENGYEGRYTINTLNNGNRYFGDQTDVIAAVKYIIENDDVLSKLLTFKETENNTFVIESTTGGRFDWSDLKIEISQKNMGSAANDWNAVEAEARTYFSDSSIVIENLAEANGADTGPDGVADLRTTYGSDSQDNLDSTNDWFTGLTSSRDDEDNNASWQWKSGSASDAETDNVINAGAGDDLTVLSTNGGYGYYNYYMPRQVIAEDGFTGSVDGLAPFTRIEGNTLQNGASNETLVFEGVFGNDTIMNFTTADLGDATTARVSQQVATQSNTVAGADGVDQTFESFTLDVSTVAASGADYDVTFNGVTVTVLAGMTPAQIASLFVTEGAFGGYTATSESSEVVRFTFDTPGDQPDVDINNFNAPDIFDESAVVTSDDVIVPGDDTPSTFTVQFFDENAGDVSADASITILGESFTVGDGDSASMIASTVFGGTFTGWNVVNNGTSLTFTSTTEGAGAPSPFGALSDALISGDVPVLGNLAAGLDFLDYSDYLTSEYDRSRENPENSNDSEVRIPVTLDYNETSNLGGMGDGAASSVLVEANEVAVARMENDSTEGETFSNLTASVIEGIFNNNVDDDNEWGGLSEAEFNVMTYTKTGVNPDLIGDAKAILKIENPGNLGVYKVFELTWSGDNSSDGGATVSARQIGTQDYGTSLTGLDDINLVGSDDYGLLIANGFADFEGPFNV